MPPQNSSTQPESAQSSPSSKEHGVETSTHQEPSRAERIFRWSILLISAVGLVLLIRKLGFTKVLSPIKEMGWFLLPLFGWELLASLSEAMGLRAWLGQKEISLGRTWLSHMAGIAVNNVTPTGKLGEATKVDLFRRSVSLTHALSAILLYNFIGIFFSVAIICVGVPFTLLYFDVPTSIVTPLIIVSALGIGFAGALIWLLRAGLGEKTIRAIRKTRIISEKRANSLTKKLSQIDVELKSALGKDSAKFRSMVRYLGISRVMTWLQIFAMLTVIGHGVDPAFWFMLISAGTAIQWIANFVPLGLGVTEGGNYLLFSAFSGNAALGVSMVMVRRLMQFGLVIIGFAAFGLLQLQWRKRRKPRGRRTFRESSPPAIRAAETVREAK